MTLVSLFDGIGTWQASAKDAGIKPLWSSEIDKFCCQVTARHFPETIQLGDIKLIQDAPYVDIITVGSPCQDVSIAGKREGIKGEKSGLFFKAVELVRRINPRFFVWENVPCAFSSNGGNDFRAVLEELLQESVPLPRHWSNAGVVDGRKCQIAWRLLDTQYWGVPQRRKRIFLVADFAGRRAAKILFEREGVSRDIAAGEDARENSATRTQNRVDCTVYDNHWKDSRINRVSKIAPMVSAMYGTGGNNIPFVTYGLKLNSTCDYACELEPTQRAAPFACVATNIVRRLTPLECERLQGLPDDWTVGGSDAQRYKAIGNGMAKPCSDWILKRIWDGIGGEKAVGRVATIGCTLITLYTVIFTTLPKVGVW